MAGNPSLEPQERKWGEGAGLAFLSFLSFLFFSLPPSLPPFLLLSFLLSLKDKAFDFILHKSSFFIIFILLSESACAFNIFRMIFAPQ